MDKCDARRADILFVVDGLAGRKIFKSICGYLLADEENGKNILNIL